MSRRNRSSKRVLLPDYKFNSTLITKFINHIMVDGKKSVAEKIVYNSFEKIKQLKKSVSEIDIFTQALGNISPVVEVKSRRIGGATYQIPVEVKIDRQHTLGMRWLIQVSRKRKAKTMEDKISLEILDAFDNKGNAVKKCHDMHKMAEANKAFSHFRW